MNDIDLTTIAFVWIAGSALLMPLLIAAVRYAVIPLVDAVGRHRSPPADARLETRLQTIEQGLARLGRDVNALNGGSARRAS